MKKKIKKKKIDVETHLLTVACSSLRAALHDTQIVAAIFYSRPNSKLTKDHLHKLELVRRELMALFIEVDKSLID